MKRISHLLLAIAAAFTFATFQGFAYSSVAQTLTNMVRPVFSFFSSSTSSGAIARPTPFLLIEQNATYFAVLVAATICCAAVYIEFRLVLSKGKNAISASVIALGTVLLVLNAVLFAWNT